MANRSSSKSPAFVQTRVIKIGAAYAMKIPTAFAESLPKGGERFVVRVFDAAPPYTVYVPTMETQLRRFGSEWGLPVPSALLTGRALRHRQEVSVALVPRTL